MHTENKSLNSSPMSSTSCGSYRSARFATLYRRVSVYVVFWMRRRSSTVVLMPVPGVKLRIWSRDRSLFLSRSSGVLPSSGGGISRSVEIGSTATLPRMRPDAVDICTEKRHGTAKPSFEVILTYAQPRRSHTYLGAFLCVHSSFHFASPTPQCQSCRSLSTESTIHSQDKFYSKYGVKFYKDRHWLRREVSELMPAPVRASPLTWCPPLATPAECRPDLKLADVRPTASEVAGKLIGLEAGCGCGSKLETARARIFSFTTVVAQAQRFPSCVPTKMFFCLHVTFQKRPLHS